MNISRLNHSLFLSFLIFLQSCTVYKSAVSLDEAVDAQTKSKVFYNDSRIKIYSKLTKEDGEYFGWYKDNIKYSIDPDHVNYVKTNNKTGSAIATGGAVLGGAAVVAVAVLAIVVIVGVISLLDGK